MGFSKTGIHCLNVVFFGMGKNGVFYFLEKGIGILQGVIGRQGENEAKIADTPGLHVRFGRFGHEKRKGEYHNAHQNQHRVQAAF